MSMSHVEKISCPNCDKEVDFTIWETINVDLDPQMREKVKDASIFSFECPHCQTEQHLLYQFLYHDVTNKFMCYFCSPNGTNDAESAFEKLKTTDKDTLSDIIPDVDEIMPRLRITTNYNTFLEKIRIFESGYDDRVIEAFKVVAMNTFNAHNAHQATHAVFYEADIEGQKVPVIELLDKNDEHVFGNDIREENKLLEKLTTELKEYEDDYFYVNEEWARAFIFSKNNREKNAFLIRWKNLESVYHFSAYREDLKKLKKDSVIITIEVENDNEIQTEDLALVLLQTTPGLAAVGRFVSQPYEAELTTGEHIYVANVYIDILFSRLTTNYFEAHSLINKYFKSIKVEGKLSERLNKDEVDLFVKDLACMFLALDKPTPKIIFNQTQNFQQLLCSFVNDFCPQLKQIVCGVNGVNPAGHILTYNPHRLKDLPRYCCELDKLQAALIPDGVEPYEPTAHGLFELELANMILKFDDSFKQTERGAYYFETPTAECEILFSEFKKPNIAFEPIDRRNVAGFYLLPEHEQLIVEDFKNEDKEKQSALVEVKLGTTKAKQQFRYRIIKEFQEPHGVVYKLTLQVHNGEHVANIAGTFKETGITGTRDTLIYAVLANIGLFPQDNDRVLEGWFENRYDKTDPQAAQTNLSDYECYDDVFPDHPLSVCRRFLHDFVAEN